MAHRSKNFTTSDTAAISVAFAAGAGTFVLQKKTGVLDYNPEQVFSRHQISVSGLDGGTYDVNIWQPGAVKFTGHQAGAGENDTVMIEAPLAQRIEIDITGGAVANPVLHFTSLPRMS